MLFINLPILALALAAPAAAANIPRDNFSVHENVFFENRETTYDGRKCDTFNGWSLTKMPPECINHYVCTKEKQNVFFPCEQAPPAVLTPQTLEDMELTCRVKYLCYQKE